MTFAIATAIEDPLLDEARSQEAEAATTDVGLLARIGAHTDDPRPLANLPYPLRSPAGSLRVDPPHTLRLADGMIDRSPSRPVRTTSRLGLPRERLLPERRPPRASPPTLHPVDHRLEDLQLFARLPPDLEGIESDAIPAI